MSEPRMMRGHTFAVCKQPCTKLTCQFCEGGLSACITCLCFEGSLPSHCPGQPVSDEDQQLIYKATLDYHEHKWDSRPLNPWEGERDPQVEAVIQAAVARLNQ
ncbi:MAG: hypothetical protein V3S69_04850 [Dehalococcoidales bacterium]